MSTHQSQLQAEVEIKFLWKLTPEERRKQLRKETFRELKEMSRPAEEERVRKTFRAGGRKQQERDKESKCLKRETREGEERKREGVQTESGGREDGK